MIGRISNGRLSWRRLALVAALFVIDGLVYAITGTSAIDVGIFLALVAATVFAVGLFLQDVNRRLANAPR